MRRPRNRTNTGTAPVVPLPALPSGLTTRQRRLVNTIRHHSRPGLPCALMTSADNGWSILFVPTGYERTYRALCDVLDSAVSGALRAGALVRGSLDDWEYPEEAPCRPILVSPQYLPAGDGSSQSTGHDHRPARAARPPR